MNGEETPVALIQWKSGKTPRQCLGSNGAEVQAITIGEDHDYLVRGLLYEMLGNKLERKVMHDQVATIPGCLVMDSRGIYDAATRNLSCLHGLRESRAGYELTLSIVQATKARTVLRWVCGIAQLADSLTKFADRKCILQFMAAKQVWRLTDDPSFTAGRKVNKKAMEKMLQDQQDAFINSIRILAEKNYWPWIDDADEVLYSSMHLLTEKVRKCIGCEHGRHDHVTFSSYRHLQGGIEPKQFRGLPVQLGP